jgi:hypothetical protein
LRSKLLRRRLIGEWINLQTSIQNVGENILPCHTLKMVENILFQFPKESSEWVEYVKISWVKVESLKKKVA